MEDTVNDGLARELYPIQEKEQNNGYFRDPSKEGTHGSTTRQEEPQQDAQNDTAGENIRQKSARMARYHLIFSAGIRKKCGRKWS